MKAWRRSSRDQGIVPGCGIVPTDLVASNDEGDMVVTWSAPSDPGGWLFQVIDCGLVGPPIVNSGLGGSERGNDVLGMPPGEFLFRLRDASSPESCWVDSNCVEFF